MIPPTAQPQGLPSILAALAGGGQPVGQMGKAPIGINPSMPMPQPQAPMPAGAPQSGSMDPLSQAMAAMQPDQIQIILNALLRQGAFNSTTQPG